MVILIECNVIFDHCAIVRLPGTPLAEDAVEPAISCCRTVWADAFRIEGKVITADPHVLSLPAAVTIVRLAPDEPRIPAVIYCRHGRIY